jgi:hypothetical protein
MAEDSLNLGHHSFLQHRRRHSKLELSLPFDVSWLGSLRFSSLVGGLLLQNVRSTDAPVSIEDSSTCIHVSIEDSSTCI